MIAEDKGFDFFEDEDDVPLTREEAPDPAEDAVKDHGDENLSDSSNVSYEPDVDFAREV